MRPPFFSIYQGFLDIKEKRYTFAAELENFIELLKQIMKMKNIFLALVAAVISLGFTACSKDNTPGGDDVSLEGKWLIMTDTYKELLIINADHTFLSTGADEDSAWVSIKGRIELEDGYYTLISEDGDNSEGTYELKDNQLTLNDKGKDYVYRKMVEDFSMDGTWTYTKTLSVIKALKDELTLPFGSTVGGEEIPTVVKTANIQGQFIDEAVKAYFRNVVFKSNGEMTYKVLTEGVETDMVKNYVLEDNVLEVTGRVGGVDINNSFMAFQNPNQTESYLFLTKENIADMFVGYALMLRAGNVSQGSVEALEAFKKEFMATFENYACIIFLQKK